MTKEEKIKEMRQIADEWWAKSNIAMAHHYEAIAVIDQLCEDELRAEFHNALAACYRGEVGASERKDQAYSRFMKGKE
jgi:hypothetical protein